MSVVKLTFISPTSFGNDKTIEVERGKLTQRLPFFTIFFRKNKPTEVGGNAWIVSLPFEPKVVEVIVLTALCHGDTSAPLLQMSDLNPIDVLFILRHLTCTTEEIGNYTRGVLIPLLKAEDKTPLTKFVIAISETCILSLDMKKALMSLTVNYLDSLHKEKVIRGINWDISAYIFQMTPPSGLLRRTLDPPDLMFGALIGDEATGKYDDLFIRAKVEDHNDKTGEKIWITWGPKTAPPEGVEWKGPKVVHIMVWLYDFPNPPKVSAHPLKEEQMKNRTLCISFPSTCLAFLCVARF